ncbi:Ppx/GppA phosphatase family protein [Georgenia halophila]|uniref:Ppx/GppA phosphatase family protein n=1 Tax=Georgenia halophila TaxID=620889 RepID=A0ABP8L3G3_9MICO
MTRVAAIDCGTNSIRLLVADLHRDGSGDTRLTDVERRMEVVRLGQDVDRTGRIDPVALERTIAAARDYAERCRAHGVERVRFVATSASRDADNRQDFVDGVRDALGVVPEVITGTEEAELSFRGALSVLDRAEGAGPPHLVVDIGGGSTEFVLGDGEQLTSRSVDLGCVRLTERHLRSDPPTHDEIAAARVEVRARIDEAAAVVPLERVRTLVGVAGTVTTVTAHALGLATYDPAAIDGASLEPEVVHGSCASLLAATHAERAAMGFMHPGRIDVIGAGALIWSEIVSRVETDVGPRGVGGSGEDGSGGAGLGRVLTSEHDILDGIALSLS